MLLSHGFGEPCYGIANLLRSHPPNANLRKQTFAAVPKTASEVTKTVGAKLSPHLPVEDAVIDGFVQMRQLNVWLGIQIGQSASNPENLVVGAGG